MSDVPAATLLGPVIAPIETTLCGEYVKVHCKPAGSLPVGEVKVRFKAATPFAAVVADDSANVLCAKRGLAAKANSGAMKIGESKRFHALARILNTMGYPPS